MINRSVLIVKPAQPFRDWLHEVGSRSAELTLADLPRELTIYLLPECDNEDKAIQHLGERAREIFEKQLDGWS